MFERLKGRKAPPAAPTVRTPTAGQVRAEQDQRMATLAMELGVAGTAVLVEEFGFTAEQAQRWFDLMIERAKANRTAGAKGVINTWKAKSTSR